MTKRIFRSILTVALAALLACLVLITGVLYGYFEERVERELQSQTAYILRGVEDGGLDYLSGLPQDNRITWVAADGTVLYDNWEDAAKMENHIGREEIRAALDSGAGQASRYSSTLGQKTLYYAQRLADGTVLRTASTQYSVWMLVVQILQPLAAVVLAACVLAGLMASRAARLIVEPINALDPSDPRQQDHL